MANETTTSTTDDPIFTSWVASSIVQEKRPYAVMSPLCRHAGPGLPTKRYDWPTQTKPTTISAAQTEATAFSNVAMSTGVASATAAVAGQTAAVTDLLQAVMTVKPADEYFGRLVARAVAEWEETDATALFSGYTNSVGTSGAAITIANFNAAINKLEQNDAIGEIVVVLHPKQVGDLRSALQATANFFAAGNPGLSLNLTTDISRPAGYVGSLFGVDVFQTSAVATANNAADRAGAAFTRQDAIGWYDVWNTRVEMHRDAQLTGTIVTATDCRGVVRIKDTNGGVKIVTAA